MTARYKQSYALVAIVILAAFVTAPALNGPLLLDDIPKLGPLLSQNGVAGTDYLNILFSGSGTLGRPVSMLTFIANDFLFQDNILLWKLTNLVLHFACAFTIYFLLNSLIKWQCGTGARFYSWLALFVTAVWLLHPLHISTTMYLVQRMTILSALFVLLGMLTYSIARQRMLLNCRHSTWLWISVPVSMPLAALCKENGLLLPVFILLLETIIFRFRCTGRQRRELLAFHILCVAIPIAVGLVLFVYNFDGLISEASSGRPFTPYERILTESRVLLLYIGQILMPLPSMLGFLYDGFPVSSDILSPPQTLLAIMVILLLILVAVLIRIRLPLVAFGILFFFAGHLMESTLLQLELAYEHRNYLPSLGIILALVYLIHISIRATTVKNVILVTVLVMLTVSTAVRADIWSSKNKLYLFIYKHQPNSSRIKAMVAEELTREGRYDQALQVLARSDHAGALLQRLYINCRQNGDIANVEWSQAGHDFPPVVDDYSLTGIITIANLGLDGKCNFDHRSFLEFVKYIEANKNFKSPLDRAKTRMYIAHYQSQQSNRQQAIETLVETVNIAPDYPVPLYLAAKWALDTGDLQKAARYYNEARKISAGHGTRYSEMESEVGRLLRESHEG